MHRKAGLCTHIGPDREGDMKKNSLLFSFVSVCLLSGGLAAFLISCAPTAEVANHPEVKIENLGPSINTEYNEFSPAITADGKAIFFTRRIPPAEGENQGDNIWFSRKAASGWSQSKNLGEPVSVPSKDAGTPSVAPDGRTVYFSAEPPEGKMHIYVAEFYGTSWTNPTDLGPVVNAPGYWTGQPSIGSDGRTLYFASERPDGYGDLDIWKTVRNPDGSWSDPQNLGPAVNTSGQETTPFIAADGRTLYFSSNEHPGLGGFDMFVTRWDNDHWTDPVNMGTPLNSEGDDRFYALPASGKEIYFASDREGGFGGLDIYRAYPNPYPPGGVTTIAGIVTDSKNGKPLRADITIEDLESDQVIAKFGSNEVTGEYIVVLPAGKNYGVTAEAPGYLFYSDNFNVSMEALYKEVRKDIALDPLIPPVTVRLNVFFDFDKSTLKKESIPELDRAVRYMKQYPTMVVEVQGHTDNKGTAEYNQRLSEARAKSVHDYLVSHGIDASRVVAKGYGLTRPKAANDTEEGRAQNRRVEFVVIKK
jgi:outer membrane protein OmpA-like peptidoglycan-associated protein